MKPEINIWKNQTSVEHLHYFLDKINRHEPFALIRPADGEYMILKGETFTNTDNWTHINSSLTKDLNDAIKIASENNIYIGIPCKSCMNEKKEINEYYKSNFNISEKYLTYANVICNRSFRIFASHMISNNVPFYYIGPGTVSNNDDKIKLNVLDRYITDLYLVNKWENDKEKFCKDIFEWIDNKVKDNKCKLFLFSVGPISKIIIPKLYIKYKDYQFVDVGSTLDVFMKGCSNRHYLVPNQSCYNLICDHKNGHKEDPEITCILSLYERPHCLIEQINAIKNQTLKAKKIILWVNRVDNIEIPKEVKDDKEITIIHSTDNFGVWGRFALALLAKTKYISIIDDDTIPGKKWFENCYETMKQVNGLLGTIGNYFNPNTEEYNILFRVGWDRPNDEIKKVDFVGHSWFLKKEWLQYLWKFQPIFEIDEQLKCGEDMAISCALQKVGISTYVPPHPANDLEMFGSHPVKAWKYGTEKVGISMKPESHNRFTRAYQYYKKEHGFKILLKGN